MFDRGPIADQGLWRAATTLTYANAAAGLLVPLALVAMTRLINPAALAGGGWGRLPAAGGHGRHAQPRRRPAGLVPSIPTSQTARPLLAVGAPVVGLATALGRQGADRLGCAQPGRHRLPPRTPDCRGGLPQSPRRRAAHTDRRRPGRAWTRACHDRPDLRAHGPQRVVVRCSSLAVASSDPNHLQDTVRPTQPVCWRREGLKADRSP
jgi:hypothetical protein